MAKDVSTDVKSRLKALRKEAIRQIRLEFFNVFPIYVGESFTKNSVTEDVIKDAVSKVESNIRSFLNNSMNNISEISSGPESYLLIEDAIYEHFLDLEREIRAARDNPVSEDVLSFAQDMLGDTRKRLDDLLNGYRHSFIQRRANSTKSNAGRKPKYDWTQAANKIWGDIFRGDFRPEKQADIEKALTEFLTEGDKEPSESTVRLHAKRIWEEFEKEA